MKPSIDNLKLKQKAKSKKQKAKKKKKMVLSIKNCNNKMKKLLDEGTLLPPPSSDYAILSNYLLGLCIYIANPLTSFYVLIDVRLIIPVLFSEKWRWLCEILHHSVSCLSMVVAICGSGGNGGRIWVLGFGFGVRKGWVLGLGKGMF